jgi:hypothetical protein
MSYLIDNSLKFLIQDLEIYDGEYVGGIMDGHDRNDNQKVKENFEDWEINRRMISLGYQMLIDGKLEEWDWKWAAKNGKLCDMDFEWFKREFEKEGITKEKYHELFRSQD